MKKKRISNLERGDMQKPVRIQMRRKKGFNLKEESKRINGLEVILVSRPSKWGNPYGYDLTREEAVRLYRERLLHNRSTEAMLLLYQLDELTGKNLSCWCPVNDFCHADVLLELANGYAK